MIEVLNLYGGLGGNRKHWEGVNVTMVELDPKIAAVYQRLYPNDTVVIGDAHQYLLDHYTEFDFIWSSPPCQSHSRMIRSGRNRKPRYPDMKLYEEILFLKHNFKGAWIVENVKPYYQPLIEPQYIGRHAFWTNFEFSCEDVKSPTGFITKSTVAGSEELKKWLGIEYEGNLYYGTNSCPAQVLRNCVHPDIGLCVFNAAKLWWNL